MGVVPVAEAAEAEEAAVLVEVAPPVHLLGHLDPRLDRGALQGAALPAAVVPGVRMLDPLLDLRTAEGSTMAVVLRQPTEQAGDHLAVSFLSP